MNRRELAKYIAKMQGKNEVDESEILNNLANRADRREHAQELWEYNRKISQYYYNEFWNSRSYLAN